MHTIQTLLGIILKIHNEGENERRYTVFTQQAGLVSIHATGIRKEASKLRYHMQLCSIGSYECVESVRGWKLIGVQYQGLNYHNNDSAIQDIVLSYGVLLGKYLVYDEPESDIWECIMNIPHWYAQYGFSKTIMILEITTHMILGYTPYRDHESLALMEDSQLQAIIHESQKQRQW